MTLQVQVEKYQPRLTSFARMREMLKDWYICPICNKTSQLFAVNEQVMMNGKVFKQYFLSCYDLVPDHLGRPKMSKQHHWVPSLKYLTPVKNILHACNMELFLSIETRQKNGKITQRLMQRSDSYVSNFIGILSSYLAYGGANNVFNATSNIYSYLTTTNITTTAVTAVAGLYNTYGANLSFDVNAGTGSVAFGMAVGTGTTANTPQTGALASPIGNGTAAGQLQYQATTMGPGAISGSTTSTVASRAFGNGSGGAGVTISEVGLFSATYNASGTQLVSLIIRDVLATSVSVANGVTATATYTISITTS